MCIGEIAHTHWLWQAVLFQCWHSFLQLVLKLSHCLCGTHHIRNLYGYKIGHLKKMLTRFYKILNWTNCLRFRFVSSFTYYFTSLPYLIRTDTVLYLASIEFNISRAGPFKNINKCFVMAFKIITCNYQIIMNRDLIFNATKVIVHLLCATSLAVWHMKLQMVACWTSSCQTVNIKHASSRWTLTQFLVANSLFYFLRLL